MLFVSRTILLYEYAVADPGFPIGGHGPIGGGGQ